VGGGGGDFCPFHAGDTRARSELETMLGLSLDGVSVRSCTTAIGSRHNKMFGASGDEKKVIRLWYGKTRSGAGVLELIDRGV